jgi:hypothetical protein
MCLILRNRSQGLEIRDSSHVREGLGRSCARNVQLQRTLYRVAKQQPERRFTLHYDKVCRQDIRQEGWQRVKSKWNSKDCSCDCRRFAKLAGPLGNDWGICMKS